MSTEVYLGAAVGVIILVLLASLFRPRSTKRRVVQESVRTDQVAIQLSRIADALEKLVIHLGASPPHVQQEPVPSPPHVEQPPEPLQKAPEPGSTEDRERGEPTEKHVNLSMFGR